jgi:ribonuclease D
MGELKDWRNRLVSELGLPPIAVASNGLLRDIARLAPRNREALAALPDIRKWQLELYAEPWLEIVAGVLGSPPTASATHDDGGATQAPAGGRRRRRRRGSGESGRSASEVGDPPPTVEPSAD